MAKPYEVSLVGNVRGLVSSMKDAGNSIEDISEALRKVAEESGNTGARIGDKVEDGFDDAADSAKDFKRDSEKALDAVGDEAKEAGNRVDDLADQFRDAGKEGGRVGDDVKTGTGKAREGIKEMGDETLSTTREMGASFSSVEDGLEAVQELAANALTGLGPQAAIFGIALAATIGALSASAQDAADKINDNKEAIGELAIELADAGGAIDQIDVAGKMREWGIEIADNKEFWELWQTDAVNNLEKAAEAARLTGADFITMYRGMTGYDAKAAAEVLEITKQQIEEVKERIAEDGNNSWDEFWGVDADSAKLNSLVNLQMEQEKTADKMGLAEEQQRLLTAATDEDAKAAEANALAQDLKADHLDNLNSAYDDAVASVSDFIDEESGVFDVQGFIDSMTAREKALTDYQTNVAEAKLTPSELAGLESQGTQMAASQLSGYKAATPAQQAALRDIWSKQGSADGVTYTTNFASQSGGRPVPGPVVQVTTDMSQAQRELASFINQRRVIHFESDTNIANGRRGGQTI